MIKAMPPVVAMILISVLAASAAWGQQVAGSVLSADGGEPVAGAVVRLLETGRTVTTAADGRFSFAGTGSDSLSLRVEHPMFVRWERRIRSGAREIEIVLERCQYVADEVVVTADRGAGDFVEAEPAERLAGADLRRRLGGTLAATMADLPSVAQRSMGPAPARPVVRGLDGNRLLVLEDGTSTGDLSASSPDHAVIVEPLLTSRIELVRGPAAFQYGSNVIGGAIDVRRGALPGGDIDGWSASAGTQLESVNEGVAGQIGLIGREGSFVFKGDAVGRRTGDLTTPAGELDNTSSDGWDLTAGSAWTSDRIELAGAVGRFEAGYGIPGGFMGGHTHGVDIEIERSRYDGRLLVQNAGLGFDRVEVLGSYKRYYHEEIESTGICGVSFGLVTYDAIARAKVAEGGLLGGAAFGVSAQHRDLATACLSFLPHTEEQSIGGFGYQSWNLGRFDLEGAVRWDRRVVTPAYADTNKAGIIRTRTFNGFSGSASGSWHLDAHNRVRAIVSRTFQPPAVEELFSEGPHLAAYSYEIGDADLGAEHSWGSELEYQAGTDQLSLAVAAFYYDIDGYIFAADTGELEYGPGEEGYLSRYQYAGLDAVLKGAEMSCGVRADDTWSLQATVSHVRGALTGVTASPLPRIPPLSGHVDLIRKGKSARAILTARGAARQERLGEFEEPTAGWFTFDASYEWEFFRGGLYHTIVVRGENLMNQEYRNHLSRIKSIMPEAGRGLSLVYRVYY